MSVSDYNYLACRRIVLAIIRRAIFDLRSGTPDRRRDAELYFRSDNYRRDLDALGIPFRLPPEIR